MTMTMWVFLSVAITAGFGSLACAFLVFLLPQSQNAGFVTLKALSYLKTLHVRPHSLDRENRSILRILRLVADTDKDQNFGFDAT